MPMTLYVVSARMQRKLVIFQRTMTWMKELKTLV